LDCQAGRHLGLQWFAARDHLQISQWRTRQNDAVSA
jgi:hypothetical protein